MTAEDEIRDLLSTYERSLNTSDAVLAAQCYASGGVFMPTTLPTARGNGLEQAYVRTFETVRLSVKVTIDELVVASDTVAYALTRSNGTQTVLATGRKAPNRTARCSSSPRRAALGRSAATCSTSLSDRPYL